MLSKLLKDLKKKVTKGWRRSSAWERPSFFDGRNHRWADEEIDMARGNARFMNIGTEMWGAEVGTTATITGGEHGSKSITPERKVVKPKEVFEELTAEKPNMDLSDLDRKIAAIKKRTKFMKEEIGVPANEEQNVLSWLEARKEGVKRNLIEKFTWPVTNAKKISDLLSKYQLIKTSFSQYTLAVPEEAIEEMEKYDELFKKVSDDSPEYILIVPDTQEFKEKKRDPIVIATSPFGKFFHVLGAWDKEVDIMHELYFENK